MIDVVAMRASAEFQLRRREHATGTRATRPGITVDGRAVRVGAVIGCSLFWAGVITAFVV